MNGMTVDVALPDNSRTSAWFPLGMLPRQGDFMTLEAKKQPDGRLTLFMVRSVLWQTDQQQGRFSVLLLLEAATQPPDLRLVHPAPESAEDQALGRPS